MASLFLFIVHHQMYRSRSAGGGGGGGGGVQVVRCCVDATLEHSQTPGHTWKHGRGPSRLPVISGEVPGLHAINHSRYTVPGALLRY